MTGTHGRGFSPASSDAASDGTLRPSVARGLTYQFVLPATLAAPRQARRWIVSVCEGLSPAEVDVVELLTSELVANAVLHPGPSTAGGGQVWVTLVFRRLPEGLRVEVHDHDSQPIPLKGDPESLRESGWGLTLVDHLSSDWGTLELSDGDGKAVWFEIHTANRGDAPGMHPGD